MLDKCNFTMKLLQTISLIFWGKNCETSVFNLIITEIYDQNYDFIWWKIK